MKSLTINNKRLSDDLYQMLLTVEENNNFLDNLFFYPNTDENRVTIIHALKNKHKDLDIGAVNDELERQASVGGDFVRINGNSFKTISNGEYRSLLFKNADEIINRYRYTVKLSRKG